MSNTHVTIRICTKISRHDPRLQEGIVRHSETCLSANANIYTVHRAVNEYCEKRGLMANFDGAGSLLVHYAPTNFPTQEMVEGLIQGITDKFNEARIRSGTSIPTGARTSFVPR